MAPPQISVVVTVRDGERILGPLLDALARQTLPRDRFEVVVVDNASTDGTAEIAAAAGATVVREEVPGRGRARNRGVETAGAPLVAFTNAGCRPAPRWLEALLAGLAGHQMAGGPIEVITRDAPTALERFDRLWRFRQEPHVREEGWSAAANLGFARDAFLEVGGFDDAAFPYCGEDVDLCLRARARGATIAWCPDAVVERVAERSLRASLRRAGEIAYAQRMLHERHGRRPGREWAHPGPLVRGDWALSRFDVDAGALARAERRALLRVARLDYAARMAGSLAAQLHRVQR